MLRREFGASDAWVVRTAGRLRLDVRSRGRLVTLLEDTEDRFWSRFYEPKPRERIHLGERSVVVEQWRRPSPDLAEVLRPYWSARVGASPEGSARRRA